MSASLTTYDKELLRHYTAALLNRTSVFPMSPEWRAWSDAWQELVPLTPEQERENVEWRTGLATARAALVSVRESFASAIEGIERDFAVRVIAVGEEGDDEYDIDDTSPPHRATYRVKDGAPPAPPMWPASGRTVSFRRASSLEPSGQPEDSAS